MKKLFSKRSGFTLVEVLVAFAVFAIMAAMVMQILRLAIDQRSSNNELQNSLNKDEELYVKNGMDTDYDATNKSGSLTFDFSGSSGPSLSIDYELKSTDGSHSAEGLNYVVGDVDYTASGEKKPGSVDPGSSDSNGSQSSRNDTRLTGTKGISEITIGNIFEDTSYSGGSDKHRYIFYLNVNGSKMADEDVRYAQIKMYFYSTEVDADASKVEYTDAKGNTYTKTIYKQANVLEAGYVAGTPINAANYSPSNITSTRTGKYNVERLTGNSVRIGTPFEGNGTKFLTANNIFFYVVTDKPISTSTASFGDNAVKKADNSSVYKAYPIYDDDGLLTAKVSPNIYGAFQFVKTYK